MVLQFREANKVQAQGQLTCRNCGRSIVITKAWLDSVENSTRASADCLSLGRLTCKKCGAKSPSYALPNDWETEPPDTSSASEEADGFYSPWDVVDYQSQFDDDL